MNQANKMLEENKIVVVYMPAPRLGDEQEELELHVCEHKFALMASTKTCGIHIIALLKSI